MPPGNNSPNNNWNNNFVPNHQKARHSPGSCVLILELESGMQEDP